MALPLHPPKKTQRLPWRELDGHAVIIHAARGEVHELNALGAFIWNQVDGSRTAEQIAGAIAEEFEVDLDTAREDTREFLTSLNDSGLIEWPSSEARP